jgi:hypothetical protein
VKGHVDKRGGGELDGGETGVMLSANSAGIGAPVS